MVFRFIVYPINRRSRASAFNFRVTAFATIFNIERLVIEDFSLPFTKGVENQMYTIKAYSDDLFDLLISSAQTLNPEP
jgi:hypothetical protein